MERAGDGVFAVGRDVAEAQLAVEGDCGLHERGDGVEPYAAVADRARLGERGQGEGAAQTVAAETGRDVQALHLGHGSVPLVQADAAPGQAVLDGQEESAPRRGGHALKTAPPAV